MTKDFSPQVHLHLIVKGTSLRKPMTDALSVEIWLEDLVAAVGMHILVPAKARRCYDPGNEGVTGTVVLTTSHASIHIWEKPDGGSYFHFDLFSCAPFEWHQVLPLLLAFKPSALKGVLIDRDSLIEVEAHAWNVEDAQ